MSPINLTPRLFLHAPRCTTILARYQLHLKQSIMLNDTAYYNLRHTSFIPPLPAPAPHPPTHPSIRPYRRRAQTDRKTDGQADGADRHKDGQRHSHERAHRYRPTFINPIRPYMRILYTHHITAHYTQYTALSQLTICDINTNSYYITLPYSTPHHIISLHFTSHRKHDYTHCLLYIVHDMKSHSTGACFS